MFRFLLLCQETAPTLTSTLKKRLVSFTSICMADSCGNVHSETVERSISSHRQSGEAAIGPFPPDIPVLVRE